ncbi:hypothetical protein [Ancylobacter polymorphus]|uniref:Twin-arginine translocation signal domain-containing protein n=1 Tax=Ancylobacter polymorphus TaxID=223390 RepID=A0A9E7D785_9HYPH|nr:hypothetical protein [Ancylobacter polymorphus]UOK71721.1 hypothetical protein K9D25_03060 [Ancylobacter polymorphus]
MLSRRTMIRALGFGAPAAAVAAAVPSEVLAPMVKGAVVDLDIVWPSAIEVDQGTIPAGQITVGKIVSSDGRICLDFEDGSFTIFS